MNLGLFDKLMEDRPSQNYSEWQMFLEICEIYLKKHEIKNPIVVELGVYKNMQKKFWKQLFGAEHIGIDASARRSIPDIHGNTHNPKTLEMLKKKLNGKLINILFIDAGHCYESVKKDFEIYSPLCNDIIALHDINLGRYKTIKNIEVWKFWDELKLKAHMGKKGYENYLFLSISQRKSVEMNLDVGIGMIIKK